MLFKISIFFSLFFLAGALRILISKHKKYPLSEIVVGFWSSIFNILKLSLRDERVKDLEKELCKSSQGNCKCPDWFENNKCEIQADV